MPCYVDSVINITLFHQSEAVHIAILNLQHQHTVLALMSSLGYFENPLIVLQVEHVMKVSLGVLECLCYGENLQEWSLDVLLCKQMLLQ